MNFSLIARAGLTQEEFAALAGVSRITTNTWVRGKMSPHRLLREKVLGVLEGLQRAVDDEKLPLRNIARTERLEAIRHILYPPAAT